MSKENNTLKKVALAGLILLSLSRGAFGGPNIKLIKTDIEGVWDLTSFDLDNGKGQVEPWCGGAYGTIVYDQGQMSVAINCKAKPEKMVFYSGPYQLEGDTVIHNVQNYSDASLKQVFRRKVEMPDSDHLNLVGPFGDQGTVVLSWKRRERFADGPSALAGVYQLVRSENEFEGKTGVPYCTGVNGTILYTPGGFVSVSLNCQPKADPTQDEPADVHGRRYFYSGTYTLSEGQAIHLPETDSIVGHIGHLQVRAMTLKNGVLTLAGTNGSAFVAIWKKMVN